MTMTLFSHVTLHHRIVKIKLNALTNKGLECSYSRCTEVKGCLFRYNCFLCDQDICIVCGSEEEERNAKRNDLVKMEKFLDKILRFNDVREEHKLDKVTSLRTLCQMACDKRKAVKVESKVMRNYRDFAVNTESLRLNGPSEI